MKKQSLYLMSILVLLLALLSACNNATPSLTATVNVTSEATSSSPSPTNIAPSETATTAPNSKVILWVPAGADANLSEEIRTRLSLLSSQEDLNFEIKSELSATDLVPELKIVVAMTPAPDIKEWAASTPGINFLAVGVPVIESAGNNLSVIAGQELFISHNAFLGGYLAALITPDYRVGVLVEANSESGASTADSFIIGARYFCGLCGSKYSPFVYYPKSAEIGNPFNEIDWKAAADTLIASSVKAVFVQESVVSNELLSYLDDADIKIISTTSPPVGFEPRTWIGTLQFDYAVPLADYWQALQSDAPRAIYLPTIYLDDTFNGFISEGKMRLFEETRNSLLDGVINPNSVQ